MLSFPPQTLAGFEVDANDFHEKMELCDVCGSFLVIGDSQSRVDAHLLGKQHMGYARIRAAITELKVEHTGHFPTLLICNVNRVLVGFVWSSVRSVCKKKLEL